MSLRPLLVGLPFVAGLLAVTGCGASPDDFDPESVGTSEDAIKGGYSDPGDPYVVGIYDNNTGGICTGTLIAPNLVLTARHCVAPVLNEVQGGVACGVTKFGTTGKASGLFLTTQQFMQQGGNYHGAQEIIVPVDKTFCGNDIALIILSDKIDPSEAVPLVPRVDTQILKGDEYSAIGYGNVNDTTGAGQRRRRDSLFTTCISDGCPQWYSATASEWVGDTGICQGDSGGPAIDLQNQVIGVVSRGGSGCSSPVYGSVFAWAQLIKDTALHASQVGDYPVPPWTGFPVDPKYLPPVGAACTQPADCPSNQCVNDGVAEYCTRGCSPLEACPEGYFCDANLNACLQVHEPGPPVTAKKTSAGDATETGGCTAAPSPNPTKPVPWFTGAALLGFALLRRRRR